MAAKKVVLKLQINEEKEKQKALKKISSLSGIESLAMDMKDKKLTVVGDVDPVEIVSKLRKHWYTEILTIGPAKEPEKEEEPKKDDAKKEEEKQKKELAELAELMKKYCNYYNYYPYCHTPYYLY